jgi:uncharacterized membrane protein HdeD (DUF308 family)
MTNATHDKAIGASEARVPAGSPSTDKRVSGSQSFIMVASSLMTRGFIAKAKQVCANAQASVVLQGLLAVGAGIAVLVWPGLSLSAMVIVFAAYLAADGVLSMVGALSGAARVGVLQGMVSAGVAAVALAWPDISAVALLYVLAAWVTVMALFRLRNAVQSTSKLWVKCLLALPALLAIGGGVMAFISPAEGAGSVLINIAIFQIINGAGIIGSGQRSSQ